MIETPVSEPELGEREHVCGRCFYIHLDGTDEVACEFNTF